MSRQAELHAAAGAADDAALARALAYVNVDVAVSGDVLGASATASLATLWEARD